MSYEKQQWANGDIITAGKLNAMDNEIERLGAEAGEGGMLVVTVTNGETADTYTADTSAADIYAACKEGKTVIAVYDQSEPGYEKATVYNLLEASCSMGASYIIRFGNLSDGDTTFGNKNVSEMTFYDNRISISNYEFIDGNALKLLMVSLIAPTYGSWRTYNKGDLIIRSYGTTAAGTMLYECLEDIATPEEFTGSHWRMVDIATVLKTRVPVT